MYNAEMRSSKECHQLFSTIVIVKSDSLHYERVKVHNLILQAKICFEQHNVSGSKYCKMRFLFMFPQERQQQQKIPSLRPT